MIILPRKLRDNNTVFEVVQYLIYSTRNYTRICAQIHKNCSHIWICMPLSRIFWRCQKWKIIHRLWSRAQFQILRSLKRMRRSWMERPCCVSCPSRAIARFSTCQSRIVFATMTIRKCTVSHENTFLEILFQQKSNTAQGIGRNCGRKYQFIYCRTADAQGKLFCLQTRWGFPAIFELPLDNFGIGNFAASH